MAAKEALGRIQMDGYWSDFKNKLKNKVSILNRQKPGFALKKTMRPLTKMEKRALVILGPYFDKKRKRIVEYTVPISDNLRAQVKQEAYNENLKNDFEKEQNKTTERLSGGERVSEQSDISEEEFDEEIDPVSNEQLIQNFYPKWLIEVEKKRADAELLRAKAEEQRASAAVKNAEAAVLQAEALNRLSQAADKQANAIIRIASVLENRGCRRDILDI